MFIRSFIGVLLISSLPLRAEGVDPCRMFEEDTRLYYHEIEMYQENTVVPIVLPRNFFRTRAAIQDLSKVPERDGERFMLDLDTWEGLDSSEHAERIRAGNDHSITVVLRDIVDLDKLLEFRTATIRGTGNRRSTDPDFGTETPARFDPRLNQVNLSGRRTGHFIDEIYVDRTADGMIRSVFNCSTNVPYPDCEQDFRAEGLDVLVRYQRSQLPHWHEIEEAARAMLRCAVDPKYRPENDKRTR
ncbi:MAG: hypothetical protein CSA74_02045 [Rhodobacterales bacterium]|nr:MAG: hypothetical protein CSA74_02045 [Rhodobacterales bacterium]